GQPRLRRFSGVAGYRRCQTRPLPPRGPTMTDVAQRPLLFADERDDEVNEADLGLVYDLGTLHRRQVIKALGFGAFSASLFTIVGCGPAGASRSTGASAAASAPAGA